MKKPCAFRSWLTRRGYTVEKFCEVSRSLKLNIKYKTAENWATNGAKPRDIFQEYLRDKFPGIEF